MCGSETLATLVSSTSMNVASMTVPAIIHGLMSVLCLAKAGVIALLPCEDGGVHVHAWAQHKALRQRVKRNFHGNSLHYFDVIPSGVLWRQKAEARSGRTGDGIHAAGEVPAIHVDMDLRSLAHASVFQLGLF